MFINKKIVQAVIGIPKTIRFNLRYFKFSEALKCPVVLSSKVALQKMGGVVNLSGKVKFGMVKIGFDENRGFDNARIRAVWHNEGTITFFDNVNLGKGTVIANTGNLILGKNSRISGNTKVICGAETVIGDNVLIGYDCTILDYDAHKIYSIDNSEIQLNTKNSIFIGSDSWIGMGCSIMKGAYIPKGSVLAATTILYKALSKPNCIYGGNPVRIIRENIIWKP